MTEDNSITVHDNSAAVMPVVSVSAMAQRYTAIVQVKEQIMEDGRDYGTIPGTNKPTLLKPGAEKLCTFFGLTPEFEPLDEVIDWDAEEPFFFFRYRCTLRTRDGAYTVGSGIGSCNSREKKYRYRLAKLVCPDCGEELRKSKRDDGYYCWTKTGGCGATFGGNDTRITDQPKGYVPNPDIADTVNTIDKMAQKRALIAATLVAVGASDFFTQDIEDLPEFNPNVVEGEIVTQNKNNGSNKPHEAAPDAPQRASKPSGTNIPEPQENAAGTPQGFPPLDAMLKDLEGAQLWAVKSEGPGMVGINEFHWRNRMAKRFPGTNGDLRKIDLTVGDFIDAMQDEPGGNVEAEDAEAEQEPLFPDAEAASKSLFGDKERGFN